MSLMRMRHIEDAPPPRRRSAGARWLLAVLKVTLAVSLLLVATGVVYALVQNSRVKRVTLDRSDGTGAPAVSQAKKGAPLNILVVGSDSRDFTRDAEDKKQFGTGRAVEGQRSDTMLVIRLDPPTERATVLSLARDLYVDRDGGGKGRLTDTFASKSDASKPDPERLIRTIRSNFGIQVNHYIALDFGGFRDIVNAIGGVKVYFPFPARDAFSLLDVPRPGCVQLDGNQALAYVRSRHYQFRGPRGWESDPTGDIGRIRRQQDFIRRVVRKAVSEGLTDPIKAYRLIEAGIDNVTVDQSFGVGDMKQLATQMKGLDDGRITFAALTGDAATIDGADVLKANPVQANPVLALVGAHIPGTVPTPPFVPDTAPPQGPDPASAC